MKIYSIDKLRIDSDTGLFDLTFDTFVPRSDIRLNGIVLESKYDMRLDNLSYDIYGTFNDMDVIMGINEYINPLNFKSDDIILYPESDVLDQYRPEIKEEAVDDIRRRLVNENKKQRIDKNRSKFNSESSLPPTILETDVKPVKVSGDNIVVGSGLFNR